jgi:DNA-directed RNA polymerase sigma subunit (sigma70/sigma32)
MWGAHGGRAQEEREVAVPADSVRAYLRQMGRVALLSAAEEVELAKRIEAGVLAGERLGEMAETDHTADAQTSRRADARYCCGRCRLAAHREHASAQGLRGLHRDHRMTRTRPTLADLRPPHRRRPVAVEADQ